MSARCLRHRSRAGVSENEASMANDSIATYLNDHLAGSVVALELLDQLEEERAGTSEASILADVHSDIVADRQELEALMAQLEITASQPRQATAWLTEKLSELKLRLDDPGHGRPAAAGGPRGRFSRHRWETIALGSPGRGSGECAGAARARLRASGLPCASAARGGGIASSRRRTGGSRHLVLTTVSFRGGGVWPQRRCAEPSPPRCHATSGSLPDDDALLRGRIHRVAGLDAKRPRRRHPCSARAAPPAPRSGA